MEFSQKKVESWWRKLKISVSLFFDKKVPWVYKIIPVFSVIYLIFPLDLINDYLPVLGQLDDLTIIGGSLAVFSKLAQQYKKNYAEKGNSQDKR
ncbi:DUF1232 domain-containing protein [Patescibacteria group bacterium]|nr:DUF1232 domain-containing protein [Patescibacteria group bacterium]